MFVFGVYDPAALILIMEKVSLELYVKYCMAQSQLWLLGSMQQNGYLVAFIFGFSRQGFTVALGSALELAL